MQLCRQTNNPALDLSGIGIEQVPAELAGFTWLTGLDLSHKRLTKAPELIGNLGGLTRLDLGHNKSPDCMEAVKALPESIGEPE
jgi:Leucine-rich repeat (LRR) protein